MTERIGPGDVLVGKYRVERIIGQGGMGVVLAATHIQLNQRVAIKLLLVEATPDMVARFLREARSSVRLKSEHVARVLDVGELPSGAPYMVMEYLEGRDLSGVIRGDGALSVEDAVEYMLHACEGIAEAHAAGIVHRDLKPANLFLTKAADGSNSVKVLDFGISKAAAGDSDSDMSLTKTTAVLGSPLYMSPEQMKSAREADARSDIWSLGAVLYELLTGSVPFNTTTFSELVLMVNMQSPPPIASVRGDVPPALEAAVLRCMAKNPADRFENVAELAWAIAEFGPPRAMDSAERVTRMIAPGSVRPASLRKSVAGEPARLSTSRGSIAALATSASAQPQAVRRGGGLMITGAVLVLGAASAGAFLLYARRPKPPEITATQVQAPDPTPVATASAAVVVSAAPAVTAPPASSVVLAPASATVSASPVAPVRLAPIKPLNTPSTAALPTGAPKKNPLDIRIKD